jgi:hypothetical protein
MAVFVLIVLAFVLAVYLAYRSWDKVRPSKRAFAVLLLLPHFLLILCVGLNLSCGGAAEGSACYNQQFLTGVLVVFILPLPSLVGTAAAIRIFVAAR